MNAIYTLIGIGFALTAYMFPTLIAYLRHHNVGGVAIINVLLGWTVLGWIGALFMACGAKR